MMHQISISSSIMIFCTFQGDSFFGLLKAIFLSTPALFRSVKRCRLEKEWHDFEGYLFSVLKFIYPQVLWMDNSEGWLFYEKKSREAIFFKKRMVRGDFLTSYREAGFFWFH